MASWYHINVRIDESDLENPYRLYNHDWPAGGRLIKTSEFPFQQEEWTTYPTQGEADEAAWKLQRYLDKVKIPKN